MLRCNDLAGDHVLGQVAMLRLVPRSARLARPAGHKEAMTRQPQDHRRQASFGKQAPGVSCKLQKLIEDIKEHGNANLTKLTILKKWFETPSRLTSFGIFIAHSACQSTLKTTGDAASLLRDAKLVLKDIDVFHPGISQATATNLHTRLVSFQNEHQRLEWGSVRLIRDKNLFFVEGGLGLYLWHSRSPTEGYRLAAAFCEHYDPRYGNGLNGPSVGRIEEIARHILATEAHEKIASTTRSRPGATLTRNTELDDV